MFAFSNRLGTLFRFSSKADSKPVAIAKKWRRRKDIRGIAADATNAYLYRCKVDEESGDWNASIIKVPHAGDASWSSRPGGNGRKDWPPVWSGGGSKSGPGCAADDFEVHNGTFYVLTGGSTFQINPVNKDAVLLSKAGAVTGMTIR